MRLSQTNICSNFLNFLPIWREKDVIPDGFYIEPIEIVRNGKDRNESANVLTGFDDLIIRDEISACFFFMSNITWVTQIL